MRLTRFIIRSTSASLKPHIGLLCKSGATVVDLTSALKHEFGPLHSMREFLALGAPAMDAAGRVDKDKYTLSVDQVRLLAPISDGDKLMCIGMNYVDHCTEQNQPIPEEPIVFNKFPSTIIASGDPVWHSAEMKMLDFEVELAIVIGKKGRHISKQDAMSHVAGYSVAHDVSERFWQMKKNGGQWLVGKTFDNFCPLGPSIVTLDEIGDPHNLRLQCVVNGKVMQDSSTNQLIFKTEDLIAWCSQFFTLLPGDIILSGTPPGVGCFQKPPVFLKPGDTVKCAIENIGEISNPIVKLDPSKL